VRMRGAGARATSIIISPFPTSLPSVLKRCIKQSSANGDLLYNLKARQLRYSRNAVTNAHAGILRMGAGKHGHHSGINISGTVAAVRGGLKRQQHSCHAFSLSLLPALRSASC